MKGRRGRGQEMRSEGLDRFISLLSKSKVGKARCKDRRSGCGQRGEGGGGDGRQGWQGCRAGSSNSIHGCVVACRWAAGQARLAGRLVVWFLVQYRLGWA